LALTGGLIVAALVLCGCSSPSIPSWATAGPKSQYLIEKRMAQRSHQKTMRVAPTVVRSRATHHDSNIGGASSEREHLKSEEWDQVQEETEQRRIDSLLAICRGC
jgi:hypothetical protein